MNKNTEATENLRCDHAAKQISRGPWFYCIYEIGHTGNHRHVKREPSRPEMAK